MSVVNRVVQTAESLKPEIEGAVIGDLIVNAVSHAPAILQKLFGKGTLGGVAIQGASQYVQNRIKRFEEEFAETIGDLISSEGVLSRRGNEEASRAALAWLRRVHRCEPRMGADGVPDRNNPYHSGDFFRITEGLTEIRLYFQEEGEEDQYFSIVQDVVTQPSDREREELVELYQANSYSRAWRHFARHANDAANVLGNALRPIQRALRNVPGARHAQLEPWQRNLLFSIGLIAAAVLAYVLV